MKYYQIFTPSFNRRDQRRLQYGAWVGCFVFTWCLCIAFNITHGPLSVCKSFYKLPMNSCRINYGLIYCSYSFCLGQFFFWFLHSKLVRYIYSWVWVRYRATTYSHQVSITPGQINRFFIDVNFLLCFLVNMRIRTVDGVKSMTSSKKTSKPELPCKYKWYITSYVI